jgi:hypothetical protein
MAASIYGTLMAAVLQNVTDLDLTLGSTIVPVVQTKLPVSLPNSNPPPVIECIPSDQPGSVVWWKSENWKGVIYVVDVIAISSGKMDFSNTNFDTYMLWNQLIRNQLLVYGNLKVPTVNRVQCFPLPALDRSQMEKGYDYTGERFKFWSIEQ